MLRSGLAAVLLVVFVSVVVAANTSVWASRTVLDEEVFASTVERSLDSPELEELVAATVARSVVEGLARLDPAVLDQVAPSILGLPAGSGPSRVEVALTERLVEGADRPAVRAVRRDLVLAIHGFIVGTLEGEPGLIEIRGDDVVVDVDEVVARLAVAAGPELGAVIRQTRVGYGQLVVAQVAGLRPMQDSLQAIERLQWIVPLLAIAVALIIVVVAHRRVRALGIVGLAVAAAGLVSIATVWLTGRYVSTIPDGPAAQKIAGEVYGAFALVLWQQAIALVVVGVVIAATSWVLDRVHRRRAVARMLGPRERASSA